MVHFDKIFRHDIINSAPDGDGYEAPTYETDKLNAGVRMVSTQKDAVDSNGNQLFLFNYGTIFSSARYGISFDNPSVNSELFNFASGVIKSSDVAIYDSGWGDEISNTGQIRGSVTGILLGGNSQSYSILNGDPSTNHSTGIIYGGEFGIQDYSNIRGASIYNLARISSHGIGVDIWTNAGLVTHIVNYGVISGHVDAIRAHNIGNVLLDNYGTIRGDILCDVPTGTDVIHNHGKINGVVKLYGVSDIFNGSGGTTGAIYCGAGNDRVIGGNGSVKIHVGDGHNTLSCGTGQDQFIFDAPLGSVETITNFKHGIDKIVLSEAVFAGLGPHGTLHAAHFHLGGPVNGEAQIDYIKLTDTLEYCPNGNAGPVFQFALLTNHPHITAGDFILIA
jgi:hypothetical protein